MEHRDHYSKEGYRGNSAGVSWNCLPITPILPVLLLWFLDGMVRLRDLAIAAYLR